MNDEQFKRIEELLLILIKINAAPVIKTELCTPEMQELYEMTGQRTIKIISKKLGISTGKILAIWKRWTELGLLIKEGKSYKKIWECTK